MEIDKITSKVGIAFMRVVKEHNMYDKFVKNFKKQLNVRKGDRKEYSFNDIIDNIVVKAQRNVSEIRSRVGSDLKHMPQERKDVYDLTIGIVNELIHTFLEPITEDKRMLGLYGQEMFDLACNSIFGMDYENDMMSIGESRHKHTDEEMFEIQDEFDDDTVEFDIFDDDEEYEPLDSSRYYIIG